MIIQDIDAFVASEIFPPMRIISLVPSQTELLVDLGLIDRLVGVTKFCVHPPGITKQKRIIGGTKNLRLDDIRALRPDLIIANKEENERTQVEELAAEFPVWVSDITQISDAYRMIRDVGQLTQTSNTALQILAEIEVKQQTLLQAASTSTPKKVLYLIWRDPWMSVGRDTFIHDMLSSCGWQNVVADRHRYPSLSDMEIRALQPELVLLSSEPYPFKDKHCAELQSLLPASNIQLVDGEAFSWYGSRMSDGFDYLRFLVLKLA
jgi:ABC-type Fe3+-hydroxamate transport system substrate-binding protein